MEIDTSELDGRSFTCLDDCAMCCLCQPELDLDELACFRKEGLTDGLTHEHVQGYVSDEPTAIRLQGDCGACYFLRERRCTIYDIRPKFCRQFPVRVHALHRIQLNANLSCPGVTMGGNSLSEFGSGVLDGIPEIDLKASLRNVEDRLLWFQEHCRNQGIFHPPEELRKLGEGLLPILEEQDGIGRSLAFANSEPEIGTMPPEEVLNLIEETDAPGDLEDIALNGNYSLLELEDPAWLPVYVGADMQWNAFRSGSGKVHWMTLQEDGELTPVKAFELAETGLLSPDEGALQTLARYAALINSRDHFLGYAYHVCAIQNFRYDLMTVYIGLLSTTMLDIWWRAGLIGKVLDKSNLDTDLAREGIRAYDMNCLAMPSIGVFL